MTTSNKSTIRWIEAVLILATSLSGLGSYSFWKEREETRAAKQLLKEDSFRNHQYHSLQDLKIGRAQSRIDQQKEALKAKETQQIEMEITLAGLKRKHHYLTDSVKYPRPPGSYKIKEQYRELSEQLHSKKQEINHLDTQLVSLQGQLMAMTAAKADSQKMERGRFAAASDENKNSTNVKIAGYTFLSVTILLLILYFLLGWKKGIRVFKWRRQVVLGVSAGLLLILFAYEAIGLNGPLAFCLVAVMLCLVLISGKQTDLHEIQNE